MLLRKTPKMSWKVDFTVFLVAAGDATSFARPPGGITSCTGTQYICWNGFHVGTASSISIGNVSISSGLVAMAGAGFTGASIQNV